MQTVSRQGETLDQIALREYGRTKDVTEKLLAANAHLRKLGVVLPEGIVINLPALPAETRTRLVRLWS